LELRSTKLCARSRRTRCMQSAPGTGISQRHRTRKLLIYSPWLRKGGEARTQDERPMPVTILLAKVIGIVLVMTGAAIVIRRNYFLPVFGAYVEQRLVRTTMSMIELLAGVFLVVGHNIWSPLPAAVITIFGWLAVLEATIYLFLPDRLVARFIGTFNTAGCYIAGGLLAIVVGLYLAGYGFAWW
jgi:hypothetical protein